MQLINDDTYRLSSGREVYANCGIIGLEPTAAALSSISEGYDGGISVSTWTREERFELATFMIKEWVRFLEECAL